MANLDKLSFSTTSKKSEAAQPNLVLRKKMAASLAEQLEGAKAELAGQPFMRQRQKWMPVEGGGKELKIGSIRVRMTSPFMVESISL